MIPLQPALLAACRAPHYRACSRMDARAGVGLPPGGPGGRSGLVSGGLVSESGGFLRGWSFWRQWQFALLSAENYNRTTTDHTTESQSAQRLHG